MSRNPFLTRLSKNKLHWNQKQKTMLQMSATFCIVTYHRTVSVLHTSCITETVHQTRNCQFIWHRRIGKCIPKTHSGTSSKNEMPGMFNNEQSLHLWERHPCTSTVWRQLKDWHEQVTTWCDLHGLLYSHRDIVFLLIQSNCIELQPLINILIWAAWLFDHLVQHTQATVSQQAMSASVKL
jgi:hypothetical protein